jgi:hypothetical protein
METRKETEQTQKTREEPVSNDDVEETGGAGSEPAEETSGDED